MISIEQVQLGITWWLGGESVKKSKSPDGQRLIKLSVRLWLVTSGMSLTGTSTEFQSMFSSMACT